MVSGFDVLEAIQKVATDPNDRPIEDVRMLRVYRKTEAAPEKPVFEKLGDIGAVSTPAVMTRSGKGVLPGVNDACVAIDLPETCYVGLFVCSHEEDVVETGHFRNVKIQKLL